MATIYRISMTQAQYAAYIAVPTNTIPSNYQIFITDAPAGTPNLYSGDGTNTPAVGISGGGGGNTLLTNWTADTPLNAGQIVLATVAVGGFVVGEHISSNTARTTGATFNASEAGNFTSVPEDTTVAKKTDFTDGSVQALLDTLRADSVHFLTSASSVDTLTTTGWYNIQNATGGPAGGGWYYYYHGTHRNTATGAPDTNYGFQLAKRLDSSTTNNLLMRVKTSGTWTAWATLATIDVATTTIAGLMSSADKTKLDGVATSAAAVATTGTPAMDGTAALGTGTTSARADHVHPSDTTKAPLASPTFTGTVSGITKAMVGLGSADNTADTAKPVSTAQQTALDLKADNTDLTDGSIGGYFDSMRTDGVINLAASTDLNTLTDNGVFNVSAPTNAPVTGGWWYVEHYRHRNTTIIDGNYAFQRAVRLDATTNTWYHRTRVNATWGSWAEVADIADFATYAPLASPALTGTPTAPTATAGTNTTQLATTAFINTALTGGGVSAQFDELRYDRVRPLTGTDLNILTTSGFYDGNNLTNAPGGSTDWFFIEHLQHSNVGDLNWREQKAYGLGSPNSGFSAAGTMYIRTMVSGVWQGWRTVTTTAT